MMYLLGKRWVGWYIATDGGITVSNYSLLFCHCQLLRIAFSYVGVILASVLFTGFVWEHDFCGNIVWDAPQGCISNVRFSGSSGRIEVPFFSPVVALRVEFMDSNNIVKTSLYKVKFITYLLVCSDNT
jgi:hypothetical protein